MRPLWFYALALSFAAPAAALAQSGNTILQGQATAVSLTRQQALLDAERAGYTQISQLTLDPSGSWTALTPSGPITVDQSGQVSEKH